MKEQNLKDKTVKGTFWSAADAFLSQGVTFLVGLVLARKLTPDEYGLIGIVLIFTTILLGFVDAGFSNALIRKQDTRDVDYNTMFIVNMGMSVAMYTLLFLGAPLIAIGFKKDPELLVPIVRVVGLLLIVQAFSIVQETILNKNIDFKTKTKASLTAAICSGAIGIAMAFAGCGVWSLVGQQISRQLVYSCSLWILNRWRPRFTFSRSSFGYMWGFGWKLMLSGFLERLWQQLHKVVVGAFYNTASLGQFTNAELYANVFSSNVTMIVQRVSYPVLSSVQDDKERMISGYRYIIKTTMFATAVVLMFMGAVAEPLLYCLIGPQWHEASTYLPFICIYMSFYPLNAINLNMLQVQGRSDIFLRLEIIKKIMGVAPICLGIFINIYWMLIGSIITGFISIFLNTYYTGKTLGYTTWKQLRDIAPSYALGLLMGVSVYFIKNLDMNYWTILAIQCAVGAAIFFGVCELTKMQDYTVVKGIVMQYISKLRNR